ncbi:MAG: hypothetical protein WCW13_05625 [archaeon]|jgi:hypothetical protein
MPEQKKLPITPELRLKARSRVIADVILDLYKEQGLLTPRNETAQKTAYTPRVEGASAKVNEHISVNPKVFPSTDLSKRADLNGVLFHEMTHFQKPTFNDFALANAYQSYVNTIQLNVEPKLKFSQRDKKIIQESFSTLAVFAACRTNPDNVEHGEANGDSLSYRGGLLGIIAAKEEYNSGKPGIGFFIIKNVAETKNIDLAISLARKGKFEEARNKLLQKHPFLRRMFKASVIRAEARKTHWAKVAEFIKSAYRSTTRDFFTIGKSPHFEPKRRRTQK